MPGFPQGDMPLPDAAYDRPENKETHAMCRYPRTNGMSSQSVQVLTVQSTGTPLRDVW